MKKRFGQMIKVKPEKLAEYKKWHANPMPGVNEMIKECGLNNYSIYSRGEYGKNGSRSGNTKMVGCCKTADVTPS